MFEHRKIGKSKLFAANLNKYNVIPLDMQYASTVKYNDENALSSVLSIAYLSSMRYYFRPIRELPTGRGYTDFVYLPKPEFIGAYPALLVELKWNRKAETALNQIKEKKYPESLLQYTGEILLVGVSYDKKIKRYLHVTRLSFIL